MAFEAATLIVASVLHLTGHVHGRGQPFDADHAGIAEAILAALLAAGALPLLRTRRYARRFAIVINAVTIIGFVNGLNMTARGGDLPDIAYHLCTLPMLLAPLIALIRTPADARAR